MIFFVSRIPTAFVKLTSQELQESYDKLLNLLTCPFTYAPRLLDVIIFVKNDSYSISQQRCVTDM